MKFTSFTISLNFTFCNVHFITDNYFYIYFGFICHSASLICDCLLSPLTLHCFVKKLCSLFDHLLDLFFTRIFITNLNRPRFCVLVYVILIIAAKISFTLNFPKIISNISEVFCKFFLNIHLYGLVGSDFHYLDL